MNSWQVSGTAVLVWALGWPVVANDQPEATVPAAGAVVPNAVVVVVPLPLSGNVDAQLMASLNKFLSDLGTQEQRPVVVLEFRADEAAAEFTGDFERALALARFVAGDRFSRVRTVAFVPQTLTGHAVLPVLACEEIIMAPDAELGAAGRGEISIDPTMVAAYREMAERRRTIPVPLVLGMLDRDLAISEVQLVGGGSRFVLPDELEQLRAEAKIWKEDRVVAPGDLVLIAGRDMRLKYGFASHLAADRKELAEALQLPPDLLRDTFDSEMIWRAARLDVRGTITSRSVDDVARSVGEIQTNRSANLLAVVINSPGGSPGPAVRMASLLAALDTRELRTVAYVDGNARSLAACVALVCDETYISEDAILGGPGDTILSAGELRDVRATVQELARMKQRDWSPLVALIDPQLEIYRYRREGTGGERYLSTEEWEQLPDPAVWKREARIDVQAGVTGSQARDFGWVRNTAESFDAAMGRFQLQDEIWIARRNPVIAAIERLGAEPWFARALLFIAFFALISEASAPGIGVAGFVSGLSFLLFFWSQFLNGTAGWLELMLFVGGLACLALEIFVLPGFGVFGVGGGVMVLLSIILASQTFVFPRNPYQFEQLSRSLFTMVVACGGVGTAMWMMRRYLADSWLIRRVMLPSPAEDLGIDLDQLEAIVSWEHLEGQSGVTTTQLTPSGKARFGDEVVSVISDGLLVPLGTPVRVAHVRGNHVLVEPLEES